MIILTGHITLQSCHLAFYGCDLVSLITLEETILDQAVSCFSGKNLPLVFQNVIYLYFKNVKGKYEWKNEGKWHSF